MKDVYTQYKSYVILQSLTSVELVATMPIYPSYQLTFTLPNIILFLLLSYIQVLRPEFCCTTFEVFLNVVAETLQITGPFLTTILRVFDKKLKLQKCKVCRCVFMESLVNFLCWRLLFIIFDSIKTCNVFWKYSFLFKTS